MPKDAADEFGYLQLSTYKFTQPLHDVAEILVRTSEQCSQQYTVVYQYLRRIMRVARTRICLFITAPQRTE